jgi:CBS domain-containing protein
MLEDVFVKDWMTSPVLTVRASVSISEAHKLMKEHGVRRLVVVDDQKVVGIITIGDVREASPSDASTLSIWELNYLWAQLTVDNVMTSRVLTITPDTSINKAAQLMLDKKVSGLPVLDEHNHLVGIITESDIFRMIVSERQPA